MYLCNEMKTFLARIFCLFMAFQVLFASTGFSMYEHFCKIKGAKTYSLSTPKKSCCSAKKTNTEQSKKPTLKRTKCCSDQVNHYKINTNAAQSLKIDVQIPTLAWIASPIFDYSFTHSREIFSFNTLHYSNTAPPISGRDRLVFIQSFLI
jgi:hypothetical protein